MMGSIWEYRGFVIDSIKTEFRVRFARSTLGGAWLIVNPLAQVIILSLVLSNLMTARLPGIVSKSGYALFLMSGTLGWSLFSELISKCTTMFIDHAGILKKVNFPKICLPSIAIGYCLVNNFFLLVCVGLLFIAFGLPPDVNIMYLPILIFITAALAMAVGVILGVINVFVRDVGQTVPLVLQVVYWFTPIVYPANVIPERYRFILEMNPLYPVISGYQDILLFHKPLDLWGLIYPMMLSFASILFAWLLLKRAASDLVDAL